MTPEMSQLYSDLEAACNSAHAMMKTGELPLVKYRQINNTIARWEDMLRTIRLDQRSGSQ